MHSVGTLVPSGNSDFDLLFQTINKFLNFKKWGFELINPGFTPLLYESSKCRVRIHSLRDRPYTSTEVYVLYCRLHAPLDNHFVTIKGKMYKCIHDVRLILCYLEGMNPKDMLDYYYQTPSSTLKKFQDSRKPEWTQEEYIIRFHSLAWEKYGDEIFNLLDINQPELWKGYSDFVFDFYKAREERVTLKTNKEYTIDSYFYNVY